MASGDFTPFATQQAVQQAQTTADSAVTAVGDGSTGLTKDVADLQTETTNLQQQIDSIDTSGGPIVEIHNPSGVYKAGQAVTVGNSQLRANTDMDGSVTPINLVIGSGANQWTPISVHNKERNLDVEYGGMQFKATPQGFSISDGTDSVAMVSNPTRKRISLTAQGTSTQADLAESDVMTYGDFVSKSDGFAVKAYSSAPTEVMAALVDTNGELSASSNITETELNYLNGVTSPIQTQLNKKTTDVGAYNSDTASNTWNELCAVGNISIDARNPSTGEASVRIVNSTGGTVVVNWMDVDEGTITQGRDGISSSGSHEINRSATASGNKSFSFGIYTTSGVNPEAYTGSVFIARTSNGVRIAVDLHGVTE